MVKSIIEKGHIVTENSDEARSFYHDSRFGALLESGRVTLSLLEALYLLEKGRLEVLDGSQRPVSFEQLLKRAKRLVHDGWIKYEVFRDLRERGYIIKTALKFGADFRVYDRGVKPGDDHARWIVYPVHESAKLTWHDFAAKNRVAHSTKKNLMIAVVDDENDVSYWEVRWLRP